MSLDIVFQYFEKKKNIKSRYPDLDDYIKDNYVDESITKVLSNKSLFKVSRELEFCGAVGSAPKAMAEASILADEAADYSAELNERVKHLSDTFSEYLFYLIDLKGLDNADVWKNALVDKKVFSKIKNNADYHPQKLTALCLCIGAKLNLDEAKDLLGRAGYAFSPCDKRDIVFQYFLEREIYDMIDIDIVLEELGLPCIIE